MKRVVVGLALLGLVVAHVVYWYLPRERAAVPAAAARVAGAVGGVGAIGAAGGGPTALLAGGAYDVCVWVPFPHQNLGALASAVDLPEVIGAAVRLVRGGGQAAAEPAAGEAPAQEVPSFGPFAVPPASELTACADLAGGRLRVVARIYPALSVVAKLAGALARDPWLAGGTAGRSRIAWDGLLWSVTAGDPEPPPVGGAEPPAAAAPPDGGATAAPLPDLPASLAVIHWRGRAPEIPTGYYLSHTGKDFDLDLAEAAGGARGTGTAGGGSPVAFAVADDTGGAAAFDLSGTPVTLLVVVGAGRSAAGAAAEVPGESAAPGELVPEATVSPGVAIAPEVAEALRRRHGGAPTAGGPVGAGAASRGLAPAALALFEAGGSRLSSLGDLPGLAVFNVPGVERWRLPAAGIFRLFAGRLPSADAAGWHLVALDGDSLRQAEALAPRVAALVPPLLVSPPGRPAAGGEAAGPRGAGGGLALGVWLDPRASLGLVDRVHKFLEGFPLASRREVGFWRDWETVLEPLADCRRASLAASVAPPSMRLLLESCSAP